MLNIWLVNILWLCVYLVHGFADKGRGESGTPIKQTTYLGYHSSLISEDICLLSETSP
jgi:hypothetical protein